LLARIQRDGDEIRKNGKSGGESGRGGLRAEKRRQRVAGTARGTGGDQIGTRVLKLVRGALERGEIVPQCARNGFFESDFQRCLTVGQRKWCLKSIIETVVGGVNAD
jgi:hypothetical protein